MCGIVANIPCTAELRNWRGYRDHGNEYFFGTCYGDSKGRFHDGSHIRTSPVAYKVEGPDGILLFTLNSIYWLPKEHEYKT